MDSKITDSTRHFFTRTRDLDSRTRHFTTLIYSIFILYTVLFGLRHVNT